MFRIPLKVASKFWSEDDLSSDEDSPALKRIKRLKKTAFPETMGNKDLRDKVEKVRYVPIDVEKGHPSTSTPNEVQTRVTNRLRSIKLLESSGKGSSTPNRKPRMHTPVRPILHTVVDDDDQEVTFIENKPKKAEKPKKPSKIYIDVDDEDEDHDVQDDDVIFVKKVTSPPPVKPYKFFTSKNKDDTEESQDDERIQYYKICKKLNDRSSSNASPRSLSKFKSPAGITKSYRKTSPAIPRWLETQKTSTVLSNRSRLQNINGNARTTFSEVFNLDERNRYQELIKRVTDCMKLATPRKPDIINLAEDAAFFRNTQRAQKSALDDLKLVEKRLNIDKENDNTTEYDPITVASINSSDSEVEIVPSEASTSSSVKINPINTLRDSFKDRTVTSNDWVAKLNSKYKKRNQDSKEKLKDAVRESEIISKVIHKQNVALLEHKLKYELSIPESLIEEVPPTVELPKLTPEQEQLVDRALGPGPPSQLLVEKFNLRIHRRDLQTLAGLNWLNDEVINFYMNLLMQRSTERKDLPRVYATNTFFYPKLMQTGQSGLRRWTRKVDIFAHDLMVIPVHLGVHWCLSIVDFREKRISYLDSMGGRNQACLDALLQYLRDEHQDKKGQPFDDNGWTTENLKDIPQQMNGSDCGMFACTFAEFSCRGARYSFTQAHMPALRRKAALELLLGKLLL
ncbi:uncharacterized protein [Epargyreus clarus]|uniref:uncharacterized protein isoform X2 n=1 Tax=Epargyreus clarus TaxID=520877 RepID=UPI003C2CC440